ncbi:hypothetical protein HK414_16095 [Ramlibacter terrae]|uniref:CBS domain-containing protein n=1 Tax=Ramlibacter terrae TaxID=2732511 RepID=A0ABX6P6B6_9BURK|nr:hypothetical protein HK414_16095 [Ramlibacter terrae]
MSTPLARSVVVSTARSVIVDRSVETPSTLARLLRMDAGELLVSPVTTSTVVPPVCSK